MAKFNFMFVCLVAFLAIVTSIRLSSATEKDHLTTFVKSGPIVTGENIYHTNCASCHGADLEGEPNWQSPKENGIYPAPPHNDAGHTWHHADQVLFDYTKKGGNFIVLSDFKSGMPGFENILSDEQIWAVLNYIKSQWSQDERNYQIRITKDSN